jgi:hypothetical protein
MKGVYRLQSSFLQSELALAFVGMRTVLRVYIICLRFGAATMIFVFRPRRAESVVVYH